MRSPWERTGAKIGSEKLRNLICSIAESMEPHREGCQLEKIMSWVKIVREDGKSPVISVSRDGVSLGIASLSSFEMASVATVSVMSEGKKLGTVYLGRAPETNQRKLSEQLTSLLQETVRACGSSATIYRRNQGKIVLSRTMPCDFDRDALAVIRSSMPKSSKMVPSASCKVVRRSYKAGNASQPRILVMTPSQISTASGCLQRK